MWRLVIFSCLTITWAKAQNGRGPQYQDHNGHGWDIRLAVPGEPGNDYPTFGTIPRTSFSCAGKEPGYYADVETNCQVFRVCTVGSTYGFQSFLCPNGTLFNQAVFVCDWWMNVDCQKTQQLIKNKNDKFENLRLGPQLMKDIKKMLTHPMRNPYDKNIMNSNHIVMQDYKPPTGQLFPNGALLAGPERPPSNVFLPSKQIQQNFIQNNPNDYIFSASTAEPQYVSAPTNSNFASVQKSEGSNQIQQQPTSSGTYSRTGRNQDIQNSQQNSNFISNSHSGQFVHNTDSNLNNNKVYRTLPQVIRPPQGATFTQRNTNTLQASPTSSTQNNQRGLASRQKSRLSDFKRTPQTNDEKRGQINAFKESQNNHNSAPVLPNFSSEVNNGRAGRELKDNLVSTTANILTTAATKIFSRFIQKAKFVNPKSQVTVKTWIVKPTKSSRQLADPTPYTYIRPSLPSPTPTEIVIDETTPYIYEIPPTFSVSVESAKSTELDSDEPYIYPAPTVSAKQIQTTEAEVTRLYMAPVTNPTQPTFSERFNLRTPSPLPTKSSRYYLPPVPFLMTERLYLPPPRDNTILSRQYLSPNAIPQPVYYRSAQLISNPNYSISTNIPSNDPNLRSFSLQKESHLNTEPNNLTFTDILTKEKLDNTVNDIVKDTDSILRTASPLQYSPYRKNFIKALDPYDNDYNPLWKSTTDSGEKLTSKSPIQTTTLFSKSSRLIATPATRLVPPDESYIYQNANPLSKLPYYKETIPYPNTIERTVSIKITIPEKIASYLFKNQSDADFDKLEILNTGSSNYLVLSNNKANLPTRKKVLNFIPIAKLPENNNTRSISDSQALVYSFLTDSINVAREHRNLAQQEVLSSTVTTTPAHFQNLNNQQLSDITNKISQLTSSQFSSNNFNDIAKNSRIISTQPTYINQFIPFADNIKYSNEHQARQLQNPSFNGYPSQKSQNDYSTDIQMQKLQQNVLNSPNKIYSGQLYRWPVPEVTNQIYNQPSSANIINPNTLQHPTIQMFTLQKDNHNNAADKQKQTAPEVEIIKAETINLSPAQQDPSSDLDQNTNTETITNLLDSGNGISAQLQDKIVGTIQHPLEKNKLVTYKTDRSYYLYTKPEDNRIEENTVTNTQTSTTAQNVVQLMQNTVISDSETFQLIPSLNYELSDVNEQQKILDVFQIDEFGAPRDIVKQNTIPVNKQENDLTSSGVDVSVDQNTPARQSERLRTEPGYSGPSSYIAPQSSADSLEQRIENQNDFNSRLENLDNKNNGYPSERPARQFNF